MKYLFSILVTFLLLTQCKTEIGNKFSPEAKNGILDLRQWNAESKKFISLDGEWIFQPDGQETSTTIRVPSTWNHKMGGSGYGEGTYRLKILLPENLSIRDNLAIELNDISTAFELRIDDRWVHTKGKPGKTREEMTPSYKRPLILLKDFESELDVEIKVSNHYHPKGGIRSSVLIGDFLALSQKKSNQSAVMWFLVGSTFIMSIYHLVIFSMRRIDHSAFWFGLFSFQVGCRALFDKTVFIYEIFPDAYWTIIHKFDVLTFTFTLPLISLFLYSIFKEDFHKLALQVFVGVGLFFSSIVIFFPSNVYMVVINYFELFIFFTIVYYSYIIIVTLKNNREGSILFFIGCVLLFGTAINDILNQMRLIFTGYYANWGFLIFLFSQTTLISRRFSHAFVHLEELRHSLESIVEERTEELSIAKKNAEEANHIKDKFLSLVSHDLRAPIASVIGLLDLLLEDYQEMTDEEKLDFVKKALDNSKHSLEMISQLLMINRLRTGSILVELDSFDIYSEMDTIINKLWIQTSQKNIKIENQLPKGLLINSDKVLLGELFFNLLTNAIKFSHNESKITVSHRIIRDKEEIEFSVRDYGIGIEKEILPNLFRMDQKTSTKGTMGEVGTGLGLPFVKDILNSLHGSINVTSKKDEGSEFVFTLPYSLPTSLISNKKIEDQDPKP